MVQKKTLALRKATVAVRKAKLAVQEATTSAAKKERATKGGVSAIAALYSAHESAMLKATSGMAYIYSNLIEQIAESKRCIEDALNKLQEPSNEVKLPVANRILKEEQDKRIGLDAGLDSKFQKWTRPEQFKETFESYGDKDATVLLKGALLLYRNMIAYKNLDSKLQILVELVQETEDSEPNSKRHVTTPISWGVEQLQKSVRTPLQETQDYKAVKDYLGELEKIEVCTFMYC
eukprot:GHVO01050779.1.p1 GENE.GHVO01050779.1~~GHVO01050779.1.p1  ORF type:complete len:234 (+),score=16.89 GHVO01050779.1:968-1669(+)